MPASHAVGDVDENVAIWYKCDGLYNLTWSGAGDAGGRVRVSYGKLGTE